MCVRPWMTPCPTIAVEPPLIDPVCISTVKMVVYVKHKQMDTPICSPGYTGVNCGSSTPTPAPPPPVAPPPPPQVPSNNQIPHNCAEWYDGCNHCQVVNGQMTACTRMMCFTQTTQ